MLLKPLSSTVTKCKDRVIGNLTNECATKYKKGCLVVSKINLLLEPSGHCITNPTLHNLCICMENLDDKFGKENGQISL